MRQQTITKIGNLGRIITGKTPSTLNPDFYGGTIPFITPTDMVGTKTIVTTQRYLSTQGRNSVNSSYIPPHSICVSCIGSDMGKVVMTHEWAVTNQQINSIIVNESFDYRYIYYLMRTLENRIRNLGKNSTAVPILNKTKFSNIEIKVFCDLEYQTQIADILSAYDNLIENNQKQIRLLEEAAQRLYKEWFIDLHFPGYETTSIVNGNPEGWERGSLSVIGKFVRGTTITKTQAKENGVVPVVAGGLEPAYFHDVANTVAPVITVSGSGANAGYVKIYFENIFASDCSFLDSRAKYLFFCYCTLKNMTQQLDSLQKGAAQPHVYAKDINQLQILLPSNKYLSDFCSTVKPFFDRIGRLEQEKKLLTEARDRLLPKLMSGEILV